MGESLRWGIEMDTFVTFNVVIAEFDPLRSLFALRAKHSTSIAARSVLASDIASYESVPSYEYTGRPNTRLMTRSGEYIYVKEHVKTVAERLGHAPLNAR